MKQRLNFYKFGLLAVGVSAVTAVSALAGYDLSTRRAASLENVKGTRNSAADTWVTSDNSSILTIGLPEKADKSEIKNFRANAKFAPAVGEEVYYEDFEDYTTFENFTVIDANNDGRTWVCEKNDGFAYVEYNRDLQMDDWMITPAIELEKGVAYQLEFSCAASSRNMPETIEVFAGTGTTVADMNVSVVTPKTIVNETLKGTLIPTESGQWHFVFHGISEKDLGMLAVLSIKVTVAPAADAPAAPSYLEITPDYDGSLTSEVKVTVPTERIDGSSLSALTTLNVSRDGEVIKTFENPTPGETLTFSDETSMSNGYHLYSAYATNEAGDGISIDKAGFTGANKASAPTNPQATEHGDTGLVTLTWDAPQTNIDGYPMNPDLVSYVVMSDSYDFTDRTTIDIQAVPEGEMQRFVYFLIISRTAAGMNSSDYARTIPTAYGLPYNTPFVESMKNSEFTTGWVFNCNNFKTVSYSEDPVASPEDSDNGMLAALFDEPAELLTYSAKIAIPSEGNYVFSFWYFNNPGKSDVLRPLINEQTVKEIKIGEGSKSEWVKVEIPLDEYAGKSIRIGFAIDSKESNVLIDNIRVANQLPHDLQLNALDIPSAMNIGVSTPVSVNVANIGNEIAKDYTVDLLVDNEVFMSKEGKPLEKDASETFDFEITPKITWNSQVDVKAVVKYAEDADLSNNESEIKTVIVVAPQLPYVNDLKAEKGTDRINLSWSQPDLDNNVVCEDFEAFVPFSINGGNGWTTYDGDMFMTYGIENIDYPNKFDPKAWMTLDVGSPEFNDSWVPVSGNKMMGSFSAGDGSVNDWLISPELDGKAQSISLYAKSYVEMYGLEEFSIYYSTTSNDPSEFQQLGSLVTPDSKWKQYSWELPEGTKYFAIVCTSFDRFVLLVDDVTFRLPFDKVNNKLTGFNIYRNGSLLNSVDAATTNYADAVPGDGKYSYNVTAVYSSGESKLSNTVDVTASSVEKVEKDGLFVSGEKGEIIIGSVDNAKATIYDVNGKIIRQANVNGKYAVAVEKGIYIVRIEGKTFKVVVK